MTTERQIERAFLRGTRSITDQVVLSRLRDALASGDYNSILNAVDIEPAAFDEMRVLLTRAYAEAGQTELSRTRFDVPVRWNSANPRVEDYARNVVGQHITAITDDMRDAVRDTVADGYAFGRSVDRMALDIVGRMDGGTRKGGVVGLNQQQAQWLANMRRLLRDNPKAALRYGLRDKRFDSLLRRGDPLTATQIDNISRQYANKLLLSRGKMIARTERGAAISAGRMEAWQQAIDKTGIDPSRIVKVWRHSSRTMHPRDSHVDLHGEQVMGIYTPFTVNGFTCQYPHDPSLPAGEVVNCGCQVVYKVSRNG